MGPVGLTAVAAAAIRRPNPAGMRAGGGTLRVGRVVSRDAKLRNTTPGAEYCAAIPCRD